MLRGAGTTGSRLVIGGPELAQLPNAWFSSVRTEQRDQGACLHVKQEIGYDDLRRRLLLRRGTLPGGRRAHDEGRNSLAPQDPLEEVVTMIYRIKGSDLLAYRSGSIDRDAVRKRVQMSQF